MSAIIQPFILALQFLTRIPISLSVHVDESIARRALMLFPAVGLLIGCVLYCVGIMLSAVPSCTPLIAAILLITVETALTGAFHLDGLADTFDAFLSQRKTCEEKLAIMKDSRIGVMGCVALILALMLKTALLARAVELHLLAPLLAFPVAGRWAQVFSYVFSPYVRQGGTGEIFAKTASIRSLIIASSFLIPLCAVSGFLAGMLVLILFLVLYRNYTHRHIGGITGDVLGSITVLSEIVLLAGMLPSQA